MCMCMQEFFQTAGFIHIHTILAVRALVGRQQQSDRTGKEAEASNKKQKVLKNTAQKGANSVVRTLLPYSLIPSTRPGAYGVRQTA